MKKHKISIATILMICFSIFAAQTISAKAAGITPYYNTTQMASSTMNISDDGVMTITYRYITKTTNISSATITTYIEKRTLGIFWTRVDIGVPDNQWVDTSTSSSYVNSRTFQLSSSGTYRACITYEIIGSNGSADTIPYELQDSY